MTENEERIDVDDPWEKIIELDETLEGAYALLAETKAEVLRCKEENAKLKNAVAWQKETIAARDETIDRLEKALEPFAFLTRPLPERYSDDKCMISRLDPWNAYLISVGEIRNARAALEPNHTEAEIVGKEED